MQKLFIIEFIRTRKVKKRKIKFFKDKKFGGK